jgi:hypothetical protein
LEALLSNRNPTVNTDIKSVKIIQRDPEESVDSINLFLRSKLEEEKKLNKELSDRLALYEKSSSKLRIKKESVEVKVQ